MYYRKIDLQNQIASHNIPSPDHENSHISHRNSFVNDKVAVRLAQQLANQSQLSVNLDSLKQTDFKKDKR